ncbi:MATE family efflux transporter, partial [Klebsiella pneumoniae]|uniref:MATE family efflux transporter n=1 Tax=Klebsiella pneumoniae TaxID=573 RepID=UPI0027314888
AMAVVVLADIFYMVIMSFFDAIVVGTTVVVAFRLVKRDRRRARAAERQSQDIMTMISLMLAGVIQAFRQERIDFDAGDAT